MLLSCCIKFIPLLVILLASSSQAIFFHLAKNGILDLFKLFKEKKELKKSISNIHHYHVHYYPLYVHSHHLSSSTIHAPSKFELDKIHINQLASVGWSGDKLNYIPEPTIYHEPVKQSWSSFSTYSNPHWNTLSGSNLARRTGSDYESGILFRVPRKEQISEQSAVPEIKEESNPLMTFLEKIGVIQNYVPDSKTDSTYGQTEITEDKLDAYYAYNDDDNS